MSSRIVEVSLAQVTGVVREADWDVLSVDERATARRFHDAADRRAYIVAHALVRRALSRWVCVAPAAWQFKRTSHGRPEIAAPVVSPADGTRLRFNLSHTRRLIGCAVAVDSDVGIDVEDAERPAPMEVAESNFAQDELATLMALPASERSRRFFVYWTLKEAYLKARGLGLHVPLDCFSFDLTGKTPSVSFGLRLAVDSGRWRFESWHAHGHAVALAVSTEHSLDVRVLDSNT
jgi:4'-phosphopantetheinyl transferase